MRSTYYDILKVNPSSSDEDIKRAYKYLAKKFHPDMNPDNRGISELRFRLINEAYNNLKTRENRARYNQTLRQSAQNDNVQPNSLIKTISGLFRSQKRDPIKQS